MPWKTSSLLQVRQRFIRMALRRVKSVAELCRDYGISQKTGFKWLARFREGGHPGLCDRSRRPRHSPTHTATRWIKVICQVRKQHPSWGAKKIYWRLRKIHPRSKAPHLRTIANWLKRQGLVRRRRSWTRRVPLLPTEGLTVPRGPNDVWTVDFKGWFRTLDGQRVDPLTVRDLFSRFILGIRLLPPQHQPVRRYLARLFTHYGLPKVIRVDHGSPFAGDGALDLSRLSVWWLRLGIRVEFTGRGRPQDNASHEQMHRIYKADVATPPAATPRAQQWRTTRWINTYNYDRPHEAWQQQVPAAFYHKSRRHYRAHLPPLRYHFGWPTRRVSQRGYIQWRGRVRFIGRAFAGEYIGFKPIAPDTSEVYLAHHLIGWLVDSDVGGLRPARQINASSPPANP